MNAELVTEWIEELRSGRHRQCVGYLTRVTGGVKKHCCLGVLSEILVNRGEATAKPWDTMGTYLGYSYKDDPAHYDHTSSLPDPVFGPILGDTDRQAELIKMNDEQGRDFNAIADRLEEWLREDQGEGNES